MAPQSPLPAGINMRLADERDLAGIELRYPDGRAWPGEGEFTYLQQARIVGQDAWSAEHRGRSRMTSQFALTTLGDVLMQPVPKSPREALEVFRSPDSEDWERDYAALMIGMLDEALPDLVAMACDPTVSEMLQQRAAEALGGAWRDRGMLMTADISGFTPAALAEILSHRAQGSNSRG